MITGPGMLRIAQVIQCVDDRSGGTSTAFLQLMAAAATRPGLEPTAYTLRPPAGDAAAAAIEAEPRRWRLARRLGRLGPGELGAMVAEDIRAGRIDVLHLHGVWSPDLVAAAGAARRAGVPCCWQPHGMLLDHALAQKALKKQVFMRLGLGRALRGAAAFVFCSAGERDHSVLPRGCVGERRVVYLPVTVPETEAEIGRLRAEGRARFGLPAEGEVVAFLGRLHPVKRLELTLRAFAAVAGARKGSRLALFGSGEEAYVASLRELAGSLGIAERVVFAGWIKGGDKWLALGAADVLVLNSLHENFGYTVPEALGVGTPVVMTENLALAGDVTAASRGHGFARVSAPEARALGEAIAGMLAAPPGDAARAAGRRWVIETFSTQAIGRDLEGMYASVAEGAGRARDASVAPAEAAG